MNNITWAPIIPLIGGFPIGAEKYLKSPPEVILSYSDFESNDSNYIHYQTNTLRRNSRVVLLDNEQYNESLDLVVSTCPCAATSSLNMGSTTAAKGPDADSAKWLYKSSEYVLKNIKPKVFVGENAPGLYSNMGKVLADRLYEIGKKYGYSFTLYKTNTQLHGIPQNRLRTFYFFWKSKTSPILEYYKKPHKNFVEYLKDIPVNSTHQDWIINEKILEEPYYNFIKHKFKLDDPRKIILEKSNTALNFINSRNLMEEFVEWAKNTKNAKGIRLGEHALYKYSKDQGVWDGSVHVFGNIMNAVIMRNMSDTIHPIKNRSLNVREALHMMGMPHDFNLISNKIPQIGQNVPTSTARDITEQACKFINNELELSIADYIRQNNKNQKIENDKNVMKVDSLEFLFG